MRICVIAGDGIGPEVIGAATRVLRAVVPSVELVEAEAGWTSFERNGCALPEPTLAAARAADAVLFGAVASPSHPVAGYRSPIVALRQSLDLYANIRPVDGRRKTVDGGALGRHTAQEQATVHRPSSTVDLVVVRENTEGLYAGRERLEDGGETAIAERVITRRASERIARVAFALARSRWTADGGRSPSGSDHRPPSIVHRPKVTIVHKANVLRVSDGLFRASCLAVAGEFPDVHVEELLVDVAAMRLAQSPERFDVLVTTNMFGDILSDVACIHGGGLGLASSANLGERHGLFEPVHGAAPDIAGKGIANPLAALSCVAMLLEWLGNRDQGIGDSLAQSRRLRAGVASVLAEGPRTPDLGGTATTVDVTEAVLKRL